MNRLQIPDSFTFNNHSFGNQQIQSVFSNRLPLIGKADTFLSFEWNVPAGQLDTECFRIDGLQKSGSENFMNLDGRVDNTCGELSIRQYFDYSSSYLPS